MTANVKALFSDVLGTVFDWYGSLVSEGMKLSEKTGVEVPWPEFIGRWRHDGYYKSVLKFVAGEMEYTPFYIINRKALVPLLEEYGITGLSEEEIDHFNMAWARLNAWDDTREGIAMLKKQFMVMPFSNSEYRTLLDNSKRNGLPWDGLISSDFFKKLKPDVTIYQDAAEMMILKPEEVLMVACHAEDLAGAKKAGLRTAYVNRPLEFGVGSTPEAKPEPFDYDVDSFIELAEVLAK